MITIYCQCGEKYFADEQHIGGKLQCKKCQKILTIERSESLNTPKPFKQRDKHSPASQRQPSRVFSPWSSSRRKKTLLAIAGLAISLLVLIIYSVNKPSSLKNVPTIQNQKPTSVQSYSTQHSDSSINPSRNGSPHLPKNYDIQNLQVFDLEPFRPFRPIFYLRYIIPITKDLTETDDEFKNKVRELIAKNKRIDRENAKIEKELEKYQSDSLKWVTQHTQWRERHADWKSLARYDDIKLNDATVFSKTSSPNKSDKKPSDRRQGEIESANHNVLPLGTAPFDYEVRKGNSTLAVDNGTATDALVRVIRINHLKENIRNFFIPSDEKYTAEQIPPGTYVLRIAFGKDWNSSARKFNYRQSFSETEKFKISETKWDEPITDGYIEHTEASQMSITLHKVPFGNFSTHPITEQEFWK